MARVVFSQTEIAALLELVHDEQINLNNANTLLEHNERPLIPGFATEILDIIEAKLKEVQR